MLRVRGGDHHQRDEVVDHGEREQPYPQPRPTGRHEGEHTEGKRRVRGHRCAPAVRAATTRVEHQEDRYRDGHAADRRQKRQGDPPALAQLADVDLALGLQSRDEEEERHQPLVHPAAEVL
jgi:hypothetical protein